MRLGQDLDAGDTVTLRAQSRVTIDVDDFEQVGAPASMPSDAVSVVERGADPSGEADSTAAFRAALDEAKGGGTVWIPEGDFRLDSELNALENVTVRGAGAWYAELHTSRFIDQQQSAGGVHLADFAVLGEVTERVDSNPDNFVNGSLGARSSVSGVWLQHLEVGLWLTGTNDDLVVENSRFLDMTADGLNLNGHAENVVVRDNFLRNTGDDSLAMWSLNAPNRNCTFENNTIVQPNLANGIAIYGGTDITVRNNLVRDTNALGSGIALSNQKFLELFHPLAGTITVAGNELVRTGALNPNWSDEDTSHPMGAIRVYAYDSAIEATVNVTDTTVHNAGTVVVQAETQGGATLRNVAFTGESVAGVYNCPYPEGSGTFTIADGGGNSGWDSEWSDCASWPEPGDQPSAGPGADAS